MNVIIPMAGKGTRLRPQTLTTPKPLIKIAGKTIIERIVEMIINNSTASIRNIGFIIDNPDKKTEQLLNAIGKKTRIKTHVFYQNKAKGTAHAIYCAKKILDNETLIVFADTLFKTTLSFPKKSDGCIFVKQVEDPRSYGVVKIGPRGYVTDFIEKPENNISNLAIVGIYYFKDGALLASEIKKILDNDIKIKGEYQITTVLENLKNNNIKFTPHTVSNWYDFGTPKNLLKSHAEILKSEKNKSNQFKNSIIHNPCYLAKDVIISDCEIGPNVSVGSGTKIKNSKIKNTIIQSNCTIEGAELDFSIIGNNVHYCAKFKSVNIGDYSTFK